MTWCSDAKKQNKTKTRLLCVHQQGKVFYNAIYVAETNSMNYRAWKLPPYRVMTSPTTLVSPLTRNIPGNPTLRRQSQKPGANSILRKLAGTSLCVPASSLPLPWVWFNNMVSHSKDQPASTRQGPVPSDRHHHWLHEIHTNKGYEDNCCCRTSQSEERCQNSRKPSWGCAAQKSSPAMGISPLWSYGKWKSGRARQTWSQRKAARQQHHLPRKEETLIRAPLG